MSVRAAAILLVPSAMLLPGIATAQTLCVECRAPDRTYSCSVKDGERAANIRGASKALEFLCISEIARKGKHDVCRAGTAYAGPCIGEPFEIDVARLGTEVPAAAASPVEGGSGKPGAEAPLAKPSAAQPPKTLEELARATVAKSKEQISAADQGVRKAGDAVGGTLKKSWDCVVSLFSRC